MSLMSIVKPVIHMSLMSIVMPCIHMIAAITSWIRKASRILSSPIVLSPINATVIVSAPLSIYMFVNSIGLSIRLFVRTVLGHCRGKHC